MFKMLISAVENCAKLGFYRTFSLMFITFQYSKVNTVSYYNFTKYYGR